MESSTLANAINSIQSIAPNGLEALDQWLSEQSNESSLTGLDKDQWQDEIEKAKLRFVQGCEETAAVVNAAEDHPFLRGRIGFLIAFATDAEGFDLKRFRLYTAAMAQHFRTDNGPESRVLLQQALLACDDYSIHLTGDKWGFGSDRNEWRTIFKNEKDRHLKNSGNRPSVLKTLLDCGPEVDLEYFSQNHETGLKWSNWRKWMVASKAPLEFCQYSVIGWIEAGDTAILVSKSTYGSMTAELRTYFLFSEKLKSVERDGWKYAYGRNQNSHAFRENNRYRLEVRYVGHLEEDRTLPKQPFALRVLCKNKNLPLGFRSPPEIRPLRLVDEERSIEWQTCGFCYLECSSYNPEEVARLAQEKWQELGVSTSIETEPSEAELK
jgi:hypothetical protein